MKRQIYDLTNEAFGMFVNRVGAVLNEEKIPHYIGGGVAVQAYILDMLTQKHKNDISGLTHLPCNELRLQDYVRSTDDVDIALKLEEKDEIDKMKRISALVPKFAVEEDIGPSGEHLVEIKSERVGVVRPTYRIYVDEKGNPEDVIAMNIFRGQPHSLKGLEDKWYDVFVENSRRMRLPYNAGTEIVLNVPKLEHLLAMKISNSRAKDLMDNKNLADLLKGKGHEFDFAELQRILPLDRHYATFLKINYPERINNKH